MVSSCKKAKSNLKKRGKRFREICMQERPVEISQIFKKYIKRLEPVHRPGFNYLISFLFFYYFGRVFEKVHARI